MFKFLINMLKILVVGFLVLVIGVYIMYKNDTKNDKTITSKESTSEVKKIDTGNIYDDIESELKQQQRVKEVLVTEESTIIKINAIDGLTKKIIVKQLLKDVANNITLTEKLSKENNVKSSENITVECYMILSNNGTSENVKVLQINKEQGIYKEAMVLPIIQKEYNDEINK